MATRTYPNELQISKQFRFANLKPYLKIYPDDEDISPDSAFRNIMKGELKEAKPGFRQFIWVLVRINNRDTVSKELILDFRNIHIMHYELYTVNAENYAIEKLHLAGAKYNFLFTKS
ncbi:MAG: hypothetical protein HC906_07025 [Bacteroidales bacterium]|nr:hypothetical protein [Bacteroidales bacterium]